MFARSTHAVEPGAASSRSDRRSVALWAWAASIPIWTIFAVISVTQTQLRLRDAYPDRSWAWFFVRQTPDWYLWAFVFAPAVYWITGRLPLRRRRIGRAILGATGACIATVCLFYAVYVPTKVAVSGDALTWETVRSQFVNNYSERLRYDVVLYWGVFAASCALRTAIGLHRQRVYTAELQASLSGARLEALHAQLRPHFLFNAHNSIVALARAGDTPAIEHLVLRLSDLLRTTLALERENRIPLELELEITAAYLDVEAVRFADRLRTRFDVPEGALARAVPPLVLQPLVENAIKHGLAAIEGPADVVVAADATADRLVLSVFNRPGIIPRDKMPEPCGLGLTNLRRRLAISDPHAVVEIRENDGGVLATVSLPSAIGSA